ncbi:MAG: GIY-YIG nuclease family protein [Rhizobiales bacterium]|nr:GIY-YIG nuclease family protein [Hyphomicrobiales bacterium]
MDKMQKRQIARDYKERKIFAGIYELRCRSTGQCWVGPGRNIETAENMVRFTLRNGSHPNRKLQSVWRHQGEDDFCFAILDQFEIKDMTPYDLSSELKTRLAVWQTKNSADRAVG